MPKTTRTKTQPELAIAEALDVIKERERIGRKAAMKIARILGDLDADARGAVLALVTVAMQHPETDPSNS